MLTIPNLISLVRLALIPVFLWLLFGKDNPFAAGWLLGIIGSTDWIDGYLARRLDQVSEVGKFLDPLADRLAVATAVIGGLVSGDLPVWFAWPLIVREALVAVGAGIVAFKGHTKLAVRSMGKTATALLYIAVAFFFIGSEWDWAKVVAWTTGVPGLVLYYVVGFQYAGDATSAIRARQSSASS